MDWQIPAKTFLLGEYAALQGLPALILTTTPFFKMHLSSENSGDRGSMQGISGASPAGRWWQEEAIGRGRALHFYDPYQEKGGLGASTAQFLGAYMAYAHLCNEKPSAKALLEAYYHFAWQGKGLKPSAYDLIAQSQSRCVYVHRQQQTIASYDWPFEDIAFVLLHSGQKLATHQHLEKTHLPKNIERLGKIVESARQALETKDSETMVQAINAYHQALAQEGLVAENTLAQIKKLQAEEDAPLATKGCGALGSDVLLVVIPSVAFSAWIERLKKHWTILATNHNLYQGTALLSQIF